MIKEHKTIIIKELILSVLISIPVITVGFLTSLSILRLISGMLFICSLLIVIYNVFYCDRCQHIEKWIKIFSKWLIVNILIVASINLFVSRDPSKWEQHMPVGSWVVITYSGQYSGKNINDECKIIIYHNSGSVYVDSFNEKLNQTYLPKKMRMMYLHEIIWYAIFK